MSSRIGARWSIDLAGNVRRRVGLSSLKAVAAAALLGLVTFLLGGKEASLSVEAAAIFASIVAVLTYFSLMALQVGSLELRLADVASCDRIKGERIGVHKAIYAWVTGCEMRLSQVEGAREDQELFWLVENVVNSLSRTTTSRQVISNAFGQSLTIQTCRLSSPPNAARRT